MPLPPPGTPIAPEFIGYRRNRAVRVRFDQEQSTIITTDEEGRPPAAMPWTESSEPLRIEGAEFVCQWAPVVTPLRLEVRDDDYGMALAFVEFVNRRKPGGGADALGDPIPGAPRFQYAVLADATFDSARPLAEFLAGAGARGWELVTFYDRSGGLLPGDEQRWMLLKREIPDGVEISRWCITLRR